MMEPKEIVIALGYLLFVWVIVSICLVLNISFSFIERVPW